jgi:hypothetical protein
MIFYSSREFKPFFLAGKAAWIGTWATPAHPREEAFITVGDFSETLTKGEEIPA